MWIYQQSTGKLFNNNLLISIGYSGHNEGKNNHTLQDKPFIGPCPIGLYSISDAYDDPKHGPISFRLIPDIFNEMFNRDNFLIHPDSIEHPGEASEGCICQNKDTRIKIRDSKDKKLAVIP
jgi:hypothetical protein